MDLLGKSNLLGKAPMKYSLRSLMKFSIRDLLWLTVVVALAVGWWVDRSRLATELKYSEGAERVLNVFYPNWRYRYGTEVSNEPEVEEPVSSAPDPNPPKD